MRGRGPMETRAGLYGGSQRLRFLLLSLPCRSRAWGVAARPTSRPPGLHLMPPPVRFTPNHETHTTVRQVLVPTVRQTGCHRKLMKNYTPVYAARRQSTHGVAMSDPCLRRSRCAIVARA